MKTRQATSTLQRSARTSRQRTSFSVVCVLSVHACGLPYKYPTMLVNVVQTDEVVRNNVAQAYDTNTMPL